MTADLVVTVPMWVIVALFEELDALRADNAEQVADKEALWREAERLRAEKATWAHGVLITTDPPTEMSTVLRRLADEWWECCGDIHEPLLAAAAEIDRLRARLAKAEAYRAACNATDEHATTCLHTCETRAWSTWGQQLFTRIP